MPSNIAQVDNHPYLSPNVLSAANLAHSLKLKTIAFSGFDGGKLKSICDINLIAPSHSIPHIQLVESQLS